MNTLERLKKEIDKEELIEIARDLIRIPSENPPGDETEVANVVKNWLKKFGFKIKEYKSKEKRVNVIGTIEGNKSGKTLIWNGHMDVVPAGDLNSWK
ncbi:MAG TPA: M20 family peptidase, partial [Thermoplasmatales archaeon]|nr:M20 family peptidase [Thermoplasmatales archaeon]